MQADFEELVWFLKKLEIFKEAEIHVILPLANNVVRKKFKIGQYILKEGEVPQGLYIIKSGICKVGSE